MTAWMAAVGLASLATILLTGPVCALMARLSVVDVPNHRSSHTATTLRGGGIACISGALLAFLILTVSNFSPTVMILPMLAAVVMGLVGFVDDIRGLSAPTRLSMQLGLGFVVGFNSGGWLTGLAGGIAFPLFINVINFMDGINGLTGLTIAAWAIIALASETLTSALAILPALALGVAVGFLPWNFPFARIFLGDSGSYFIGALVASTIIIGETSVGSKWPLVAPLALYLGDVLFTLARRAAQRAPLLSAHREHSYQVISRQTPLGHTGTATLVSLGALLCGATALLLSPTMSAGLTILVVACYLLTAHLTKRPQFVSQGRKPL